MKILAILGTIFLAIIAFWLISEAVTIMYCFSDFKDWFYKENGEKLAFISILKAWAKDSEGDL